MGRVAGMILSSLGLVFLLIAIGLVIYVIIYIASNPTIEPLGGGIALAGAVSVFIIICSTHVHWFLRPLNTMRYADAYKPQRYIIGAPELPRPVG